MKATYHRTCQAAVVGVEGAVAPRLCLQEESKEGVRQRAKIPTFVSPIHSPMPGMGGGGGGGAGTAPLPGSGGGAGTPASPGLGLAAAAKIASRSSGESAPGPSFSTDASCARSLAS